jgi:hypothetical protein
MQTKILAADILICDAQVKRSDVPALDKPIYKKLMHDAGIVQTPDMVM